ncbi:MAG: copper chaperone PCu(A)C [Rhodocyclales bacterium]|nr:copper chaperone PCu(A)C [Rhodocyclales bacterium]
MIKLAIATALSLFTLVCSAHEYKLGNIRIVHPWARATLPGAQTGGVYLQLRNDGAADRLVSAKAEVAEAAEIHVMSMDGNVMQMRKLDKGVELPAGQTVEFKSGGLHIMLVSLKAPLKEGSMIPLRLRFEKAGEVSVDVKVESLTKGGEHQH